MMDKTWFLRNEDEVINSDSYSKPTGMYSIIQENPVLGNIEDFVERTIWNWNTE